MDMDQLVIMLVELLKWPKWDLKLDKLLMDSMLQEIQLLQLEKVSLLVQPV
jgi:hypothetical protein